MWAQVPIQTYSSEYLDGHLQLSSIMPLCSILECLFSGKNKKAVPTVFTEVPLTSNYVYIYPTKG